MMGLRAYGWRFTQGFLGPNVKALEKPGHEIVGRSIVVTTLTTRGWRIDLGIQWPAHDQLLQPTDELLRLADLSDQANLAAQGIAAVLGAYPPSLLRTSRTRPMATAALMAMVIGSSAVRALPPEPRDQEFVHYIAQLAYC